MDAADLSQKAKGTAWHSISVEETLENLQTHLLDGLTSDEVKARQTRVGYNELIQAPRPTFWKRLGDQIRSFLVLILVVSSIVSLLLGDYLEAAAIMAIVGLNAALGVIQESRAEEALAALKKLAAPEAQVIRDSHQQTIPTRELVPGDVVLLETGNYIPADVRLVDAVNLRIDESSLTGESVPVQKYADTVLDREIPLGDRKNTAYMSTIVTYGRGRGIVVSTGMHTQIGLIAQMVQSFDIESTPLQRKLEQLGRTLGLGALVLCGLVFIIGILRYVLNPASDLSMLAVIKQSKDMFIVAVSLAIAAVPEGLPAVVTICLALGMRRMVQRHALLRQLSAVETLGSATVICSDKTGTLTQNAMTVVKIVADDKPVSVSGEGYIPKGQFTLDQAEIQPADYPGMSLLLQALTLCNDAYIETSGGESGSLTYRMVGDPTEGALVVAAAKAGFWRYQLEEKKPRVAEIPFDSERKRMTTIHRWDMPGQGNSELGGPVYLAIVKGAPELILGLCTHRYLNGEVLPLTAEDRKHILERNASMASQALRVLAGAVKRLDSVPAEVGLRPGEVEKDLVFVGLVGMIDPPRAEVKPAISKARNAGIRTMMITGDYPRTALAVAREIGLLNPNGRVLVGSELEAMDDPMLARIVQEVDVYARVSPQHKVRIVEALQTHHHVVSMTGDGVNDAPALKRADIGVAMGITGTDVSKEAAAMVLTDDNYASIVSAIEEGRIIYSNIRKFVYYLLSCNVAEILIIFLATLLGWPLPLTAIQLLVLNLITDGAPALALGLEKGDPDIMDQPPRKPDEPVINRVMQRGIFIQTIAITAAVLTAFRIGLALFPDHLATAQTFSFATLSISELLRAYTSRSEHYNLWKLGFFTNSVMQYAVASSLAILLVIIYFPPLDPIFNTAFLTLREWAIILPLILFPSVVAEISKIVQSRVKS